MGAGRTELLETLAGRITPPSGRILLDGRPIEHASIAERIERGLTLVPEDRQRDGLVQSMSVGQNLTLASLWHYVKTAWVARDKERDAVEQTMRDVTVKAAGPDAPIGSLSGGNQQKVVLGKALLTKPRVLLLDEPTRGIDVGAKADIFELITQQTKQGLGGPLRHLRAGGGAARPRPAPGHVKGTHRPRASPGSGDEGGDHGGIGRDHPGRGRSR